MKVSHLLGLNARTMLFSYQYNSLKGKSIASGKLRTKRYLAKAQIPVPQVFAKFTKPEKILKYDWTKLPDAFALKPNKGLGGEGIIIAKKKSRDKTGWITTKRTKVTVDDLKLHAMDILEGAYSVRNVPDIAFVEEYVGRHKAFRRVSYRGTPDIRIIVFNKVPVIAMLRLPTKESGGRANLHQGAIAVGIDIATGITTKAYWHGKYISRKPGSKRKLHGIKIPKWTRVLETAVMCQEATGLGFFGADIVFHPEKGPMVLELNFMPGLSIQMANATGLKKRLERVEDLEVKNATHGVKIAKALFAARFADRVMAEDGVKTVKAIETIKIRTNKTGIAKKFSVPAKMDTGAWRTSISEELARKLGLLEKDNILWTKKVRSSLGTQERAVISLTFWLTGRKITTPASVAKRMALKFPVIIGRKNLRGMLVDPALTIGEKRDAEEEAKKHKEVNK